MLRLAPTMRKALADLRIDGVHTTADFHLAILASDAFSSGQYDCSFIEKNIDHLLRQRA